MMTMMIMNRASPKTAASPRESYTLPRQYLWTDLDSVRIISLCNVLCFCPEKNLEHVTTSIRDCKSLSCV